MDRKHIIGHVEVPGTDHTDPGPHWDWDRYMRLVREAASGALPVGGAVHARREPGARPSGARERALSHDRPQPTARRVQRSPAGLAEPGAPGPLHRGADGRGDRLDVRPGGGVAEREAQGAAGQVGVGAGGK